jgi:hypothetical protein
MCDGDELLLAVGKRDDDLLVRELDGVRRLEHGRLDADQFVKKHPRVSVDSAFGHELELTLAHTRRKDARACAGRRSKWCSLRNRSPSDDGGKAGGVSPN